MIGLVVSCVSDPPYSLYLPVIAFKFWDLKLVPDEVESTFFQLFLSLTSHPVSYTHLTLPTTPYV